MIVLIGESGGGKSTVELEIERLGEYKRIISYTTRPIRYEDGEVDDVNYHFIDENTFDELKDEDFFAEATKYRGWQYGIAQSNCRDDSIAVLEPTGYRQILEIDGLNPVGFHIDVSERERLIRLLVRGDDIMECIRRIFSDQGAFNGIEHLVDYKISNEDCFPDFTAIKIIELYEQHMKLKEEDIAN